MQFKSMIEGEPFREPALWQELEKTASEAYLFQKDPQTEIEERLYDFAFCAYAAEERESLDKIQAVSLAVLRRGLSAEKLQQIATLVFEGYDPHWSKITRKIKTLESRGVILSASDKECLESVRKKEKGRFPQVRRYRVSLGFVKQWAKGAGYSCKEELEKNLELHVSDPLLPIYLAALDSEVEEALFRWHSGTGHASLLETKRSLYEKLQREKPRRFKRLLKGISVEIATPRSVPKFSPRVEIIDRRSLQKIEHVSLMLVIGTAGDFFETLDREKMKEWSTLFPTAKTMEATLKVLPSDGRFSTIDGSATFRLRSSPRRDESGVFGLEEHVFKGELRASEIALCVEDLKHYTAYVALGCLNLIYKFEADREPLAAAMESLKMMQGLFDKISASVMVSILSVAKDAAGRKYAFKNFLSLAHHSAQAGNYHAAYALFSGLGRNPVERLREFSDFYETPEYKKLKELFPFKAFTKLRQEMRARTEPCIPYSGIVTTDLTFAGEGNTGLEKKVLQTRILEGFKIALTFLKMRHPHYLEPNVHKSTTIHFIDRHKLFSELPPGSPSVFELEEQAYLWSNHIRQ